jgi:aminoglycoside 3-N-acetyltransferase
MAGVTSDDLRRGIRALGLPGRAVCVHSSLRSFGAPIDGGADGLIDAFLAEGCTLMVPAFTDDFALWPPDHLRPPRNGTQYDRPRRPYPGEGRVFTSDCTEVTLAEMGRLPATLAARSLRRRGQHPLLSFVAIGPQAEALIAPQRPLDVFAPLRALEERAGAVLLIGVGFTNMTLIHRAEAVAGRTLFRRWANGPDGRAMMVETSGCSSGFDAFETRLAPLGRETRVLASRWRAFPAAETVAAAARAIREHPEITACGRPTCERCRDALLGGPILPA